MGKAKASPAKKPATRRPSSIPDEPALRLEYLDPAELQANPSNWRLHPKTQTAALADVIAEVGWAGALLYNEATGNLIDGHARKELFQGQKVPVLIGSWSPEQERKILATLDPIASLAEADKTKLDALLREVQTGSEHVGKMLTDLATANGIIPGLNEKAEDDEPPPIDRAGELQKKWKTASGQLWLVPSKTVPGKCHRLLCGDSTKAEDVQRVMGGEKTDGVITDPPYSSGGMTRGDRQASTTSKYVQAGTLLDENDRPDFAGDNKDQRAWVSWCERWLALYLQYARAGTVLAIWVDWRQLPAITDSIQGAGWLWRGIGVWDKTEAARPLYGRFRPQCEYLVWGSAGKLPINDGNPCYPGVCRQSVDKDKKHITQKPVEAVAWSASMVKVDGIVFDPFLGSGTTIVAAEQASRLCYGIEISDAYCGVILERLKNLGLEPHLS